MSKLKGQKGYHPKISKPESLQIINAVECGEKIDRAFAQDNVGRGDVIILIIKKH